MEVCMNQITKKLLLGMGILSITMLSGCGSDSNKDAGKEATSDTEETKEKLVTNDLYVEPLNPTTIQIRAYNKLSQAVKEVDDKKEAEMVAVSFVLDFFTLSNKSGANDIGGLAFIPSDNIRRFMEFSGAYYYSNYPTIVNQYGKDALPEVSKYKVESVTESNFTYNKQDCNGYLVELSLTYGDTKIPEKSLKTKMKVSVVQLDDYDYDRSIDYKGEVVYDTAMKSVFRILAIED